MPSLRPLQTETFDDCLTATILPNADQQAEFARQLDRLIVQQRPFTGIFTWVVYSEGWGQLTSYYPEFGLTNRVRQLDPTQSVDSTTGWYDHGADEYNDNHHYRKSGVWLAVLLYLIYAIRSYSRRHPSLCNVQAAINTINQTYKIDISPKAWNYGTATAFSMNCLTKVQPGPADADVEGEVSGLLTRDRRILRPDVRQWQTDIHSLNIAASSRSDESISLSLMSGSKLTSLTPDSQQYYESSPSWYPNGFEYSATPRPPFAGDWGATFAPESRPPSSTASSCTNVLVVVAPGRSFYGAAQFTSYLSVTSSSSARSLEVTGRLLPAITEQLCGMARTTTAPRLEYGT
ncbi:hypothetical protein LTR49_026379 [Elasticomyces elasticus]|nr:hypothetical protein LTR49_026379 [Elasticomyces elasticus]